MTSRVLRAAQLITCLFVAGLGAMARADVRPPVLAIPRAQHPITMDGTLGSWDHAFISPLNATHPDFYNRATQIYYLWDADALYIGVRALDRNPTHISPDTALYDGDAVEFYLDVRPAAQLGGSAFGPGTLHMFFTAITGHELKPRYILRDIPEFRGMKLEGVEIKAASMRGGYTLEFKLPWSNLGTFKPAAGTPIGIDIEMGSADGDHRVHRTFAFSSPTSVSTPSTFGRAVLVDKLDFKKLAPYSRALCPFDVQTPGNYGRVLGVACFSPTVAPGIAKVVANLMDANGAVRKTAENTSLRLVGGAFPIWRGEWETFDLPPGQYTVSLTSYDAAGTVLTQRTRRILLDQ